MSTYIQRTKALTAALVLALAMAFGLVSTQQAYAAEGGELQAGASLAPVTTQADYKSDVVAAPLVTIADDGTEQSADPADLQIEAIYSYTSSTKAKRLNEDGTPKDVAVTISASGLQKVKDAEGNVAYKMGVGIPAAEGNVYAYGMGKCPSEPEFSADAKAGSFTKGEKTYDAFYFASATSLAGQVGYVAVKNAAGYVTKYAIDMTDVYAAGELSRGLYEVDGLQADTGMILLDTADSKAYIKVDNGQVKLLVRVYNIDKYDYMFVGGVDARPADTDYDKMIKGVPVPADAAYIESGAQKSRIFTDNDGVLGAKGMKYKAAYFELPITQADVAAKSVTVSLHRSAWSPSKPSTWMGESDHFLTFTDCAAVEGANDLADGDIYLEETQAAVDATNKIPFEPTADDMAAYATALTAYGELDYSPAYIDRLYLDKVIPEIGAKIKAADAAIPNIVPEDGEYIFSQTLNSYNYPSVAEGLYSDSLYSGVLTVKDGKMTVTVAQRRGSYDWAYRGFPTDAAAAEKEYGSVDKIPGIVSLVDEADVYLDHAAGTIGPDGTHEVDTAGLYKMYTGTFEISSLEKPQMISWKGSNWYNRSFTFHQANLYPAAAMDAMRSINALLNSPDQEDPTVVDPAYKVDSSKITDANEAAVKAARAAYNGLSAADKAILGETMVLSTPEAATDGQTYLQALNAAEKYFNEKAAAQKKAADKKAADGVVALIKKVPAASKVTGSSETAITKARAAYNKLTKDQKALVSKANVTKLTKAEAKIKALKKVTKVTVNTATVNVTNIKKAIKKAKGDAKYVKTIVIGAKATKITKNTFKGFAKVTTVQVKSTKFKKAANVKNCFKGSKVTTVKVPKAKLKAYKKIFTKKNTGAKKLTVKK